MDYCENINILAIKLSHHLSHEFLIFLINTIQLSHTILMPI